MWSGVITTALFIINMSDIFKHIKSLYEQLKVNESQHIDKHVVEEAMSVIRSIAITDNNSLFYVLAAVNLLNAAIKTEEYAPQISYDTIKITVSKIAELCLKDSSSFVDTSVYYDVDHKCVFFDVLGVDFRFDQIIETELITSIAANNMPITWKGVRLQRIAQSVFEYAKKIYNIHGNVTHQSTNPAIHQETENSIINLIPCPECQHLISQSAKFCPNCGYVQNVDNEIVKGVSLGDHVRIAYEGIEKNGQVTGLGKQYLEITIEDGKWQRVRYDAINRIELLNVNPSDQQHRSSSESFIEEIINCLKRVLEKEGIKNNSLIITNATITDGGTGPYAVKTDNGERVLCTKQGCLYLGSKRIFLSDNIKGQRVYCGNLSTDGICRSSIIAITYDKLLKLVEKRIAQKASKAKTALQVLILYLNRVIKKPDAFFELKQFEKNAEFFFGKFDVDSNELIEGQNTQEKDDVYKTETERRLANNKGQQLKIVGRIDLDANNGRTSSSHIKPMIITSDDTVKFLNEKLPHLSEARCKALEKELDSLIRRGNKEECLSKSYQILNTHRPTSKYLRSYLDRIVNTEIALGHTEEALKALAYLIAFSEAQKDSNVNTLSHLYISLARLLSKQGLNEEAILALDWAEHINPSSKKATIKLRNSIGHLSTSASNNVSNKNQESLSVAQNIVVSPMLFQDVEHFAKSQNSLEDSEIISPFELFIMAETASVDSTKSFEFRAQMFLDAAASFYNQSLTSANEFKMAIAHYARMKGNSLYAKIAESVQQYPDSQSHLIAECDSARCYYLDALGLYNDLSQKRFLQELLLKYLKIESLVSQIEGGKTPNPEWNKGTLKKKMSECLNDENIESQKVLYRACIAIGSSSERTWNTLSQDQDGIGPLYWKFVSPKFRDNAYELINSIEKCSIPTTYAPGEFLRKVFENRQLRIKELKAHLDDCLSWMFNQFDIESFEHKWNEITAFSSLMTATDISAFNAVSDVIAILKPYAGRRENERYRNLVSSQQILLKSQKVIAENTTYYGRIFFFHLFEKWLKELGRQIEEREANALPKLEITPDPCYIKSKDGISYIDFIVSNNGDSTAQSFHVDILINDKSYKIEHNDELSSGDYCEESLVSDDFNNLDSFDVYFSIVAKYQNRDLKPIESEATYEKEDGEFLTDENDIPWTISATPGTDVFKGREEILNKLVNHYLSKDRTTTYILYGLTRTGKSSILDYLRERIDNQTLKEDQTKQIKAFKWYLNEFSYADKSVGDFWTWALETNICNELDKVTPGLVDAIHASYPNGQAPEASKWSQEDFNRIIDVLNSHNIIPLITIDEFSYVRDLLKNNLLDSTFISTLRNRALEGKACFVYAGTYDIKDLPNEKEYGIVGQMNNTTPMHINKIDEVYANELIDACPKVVFDNKVKSYIRTLSGCIPYWIQWICRDCGKYAVAHEKKHLGLRDVKHVVNVLTGSIPPDKCDNWEAMDETNFHNNQLTPGDIPEHQLFTCLAFLLKDSSPEMGRGISMEELMKLWDNYNVASEKRLKMVKALSLLEERKVIEQFTDENREVYRFCVELFRCYWYNNHKDLNRILSL